MDKRIKKKWIAALRSGEYAQGKDCLLTSTEKVDKFCCLGVLCDLHARETGGGWEINMWGDAYYFGENRVLPPCVYIWAGVDEDPIIKGRRLSSHNDDGASFKRIANLIDKYL